MAIDATAGKDINEKEIPGALKGKTGVETLEAASVMDSSKELLMRAQQNAEEAKKAALGAITRFYQESQISEKKGENGP